MKLVYLTGYIDNSIWKWITLCIKKVCIYLIEHVIEDEKHINDLSGNNADAKAVTWQVEMNTLHFTV